MKKFKNKKGFTLTELIVVIVIIAILATVMLPTLTGYINRAKNSAAEQEAQQYVTAFSTWQIETSGEEQTLDSFKSYCVELEIVSASEVNDIILDADVENKTFVIKTTKDLYVKWENGQFEVSKENLVKPGPYYQKRVDFYDEVIKVNMSTINDLLKDGEVKIAQLEQDGINKDGSINIVVRIFNGTETASTVVEAIKKTFEIIKANNGQSVFSVPSGSINEEEYARKLEATGRESAFVSIDEIEMVGLALCWALTYDSSLEYEQWSENATTLLNDELSNLVDANLIKVYAKVNDGVNPEYEVVYNFDFVLDNNN